MVLLVMVGGGVGSIDGVDDGVVGDGDDGKVRKKECLKFFTAVDIKG